MTARRRRKRKQMLDGLKETGVCWELTEESLDCTQWRTAFGRERRDVVERISE